tara:strand:- start:670 stop:930 length:261 start_codon:yes stop_codon:yes gene_type:complete
MDKLSKYMDNISDLEKDSKYSIQGRFIEDENEVRTRRQNIRIYILFGVLVFILYIIMKEYVYEYVIIKRGGLNHLTLCDNVPDGCY